MIGLNIQYRSVNVLHLAWPAKLTRQTRQNFALRKLKFHAQKMQILHSKIEILRSENANFALKNCSK